MCVCKYASGERSEHISMFKQSRDIRRRYVYNGQSGMRDLRNQKSMCSIVHSRENHAAARRFDRHYLENSSENQNNYARHWILRFVVFSTRDTIRIATREQRGAFQVRSENVRILIISLVL